MSEPQKTTPAPDEGAGEHVQPNGNACKPPAAEVYADGAVAGKSRPKPTRGRFGIVGHDELRVIRSSADTDSAAFIVYVFLATYANENRECWPSVKTTLPLITGLSRGGVQKALKQLRKIGAIISDQRAGCTNFYQLPRLPWTEPHNAQMVKEGAHSSEHPSGERCLPGLAPGGLTVGLGGCLPGLAQTESEKQTNKTEQQKAADADFFAGKEKGRNQSRSNRARFPSLEQYQLSQAGERERLYVDLVTLGFADESYESRLWVFGCTEKTNRLMDAGKLNKPHGFLSAILRGMKPAELSEHDQARAKEQVQRIDQERRVRVSRTPP